MKSARNIHPARPTIAVIVPKYGLVGGGERFVFEVTERMARTGRYEFHVFANCWRPAEGSPVLFHKVPTVKFPRFLRAFVFPWFAQRLVARGGFDLVHSHEKLFHADIFTLHGAPHGTWVREIRQKTPSLFDRGAAAVERHMIKNGAGASFLPVSSITKEAFRRAYTTLPGTWQILHPGVDVARFSAPDRDMCRAAIRQRYGIGASDLLLLFVGMNFETKGLDTVIAAVATARAERPEANIRLLVVGRGNEKKYAAICRSMGVAGAVTFAGTQSEGIEHYYRAADIFIMPSAFDTFGMVVLEAMAAGLPVIVSASVGAKDVVEEGVNGFVLPDWRDAGAAAGRILQMRDGERRTEMGMAAARSAALHDWSHLVCRMESLYQDVLQRKNIAGAGS